MATLWHCSIYSNTLHRIEMTFMHGQKKHCPLCRPCALNDVPMNVKHSVHIVIWMHHCMTMTIPSPLIVHLNFPYDSKIFINQLSHMSSISIRTMLVWVRCVCVCLRVCRVSVSLFFSGYLVCFVSMFVVSHGLQRDWCVFALIHVIMTAGWTMVIYSISISCAAFCMTKNAFEKPQPAEREKKAHLLLNWNGSVWCPCEKDEQPLLASIKDKYRLLLVEYGLKAFNSWQSI